MNIGLRVPIGLKIHFSITPTALKPIERNIRTPTISIVDMKCRIERSIKASVRPPDATKVTQFRLQIITIFKPATLTRGS